MSGRGGQSHIRNNSSPSCFLTFPSFCGNDYSKLKLPAAASVSYRCSCYVRMRRCRLPPLHRERKGLLEALAPGGAKRMGGSQQSGPTSALQAANGAVPGGGPQVANTAGQSELPYTVSCGAERNERKLLGRFLLHRVSNGTALIPIPIAGLLPSRQVALRGPLLPLTWTTLPTQRCQLALLMPRQPPPGCHLSFSEPRIRVPRPHSSPPLLPSPHPTPPPPPPAPSLCPSPCTPSASELPKM